MTTYINPFSGDTIYPSTVSYEAISFTGDYDLQWPVNGNNQSPVSGIIDGTATATPAAICLPPANQVSTGQSILIRNVGINTFEVQSNTGASITTIGAGVAKYVFLTDNSTVAGIWSAITFGAGTSQADAASLAGEGLVALNSVLNQAYPVQNYSSDFTLVPANRANFAVWNGGAGTVTLPSATAVANNWFVNFRNNGTGTITLTPQGTDTIDGNATQQLQPTESLVIVSNGVSGFNSFGYGRSNLFAYTQLTLALSGGTYTLSSAQAANTIQEYTGALSTNQLVVLPPTVQLYSFTNTTSGAYTLTCTTGIAGANIVTVPQGTSIIAVCDGTNVYNANTAITGTFSSATLDPGSSVAPSLNFVGNLDTGLYLGAPGAVGIAAGGISAAVISPSGANFLVGIHGGTF